MSTGKWNAVILSIACVVLGLALGFVLGGLFAPPVIGEPWLKSYQGLLAAFLALSAAGFGLVVATWNVLRQLRINLMSREEDRMERDLGLACTRFRRHRVRCFDGAGGGSWRDGSLRESSSLRLCA
jgi:hypothetical protein